ncbi:MAG: hypothetical protein H0T73_11450 [Ardenticatenales bacterium]|nr:hypothetical protein [Ardenticatenales bacterium]
MQPGWPMRAALWLLLAESARANRAHYPHLPTVWLPHALGNSLVLCSPELIAALDRRLGLEALCQQSTPTAALYQTLNALCVENPRWGYSIAPLVLGYVLSHPRLNIYQGRWARWRFLGFGLDALPHSITAFALTLLMRDGLETLGRYLPDSSLFASVVQPLARHPALTSAAALAFLSAVWEIGEYLIQQEELRRTGGNREQINMQWSVADMSHDLLSNATGWGLATWLRQR